MKSDSPQADTIASVPVPACYLCGSDGARLYEGLIDTTYGAPGVWNLNRCPNPDCGLVWLDPMPSASEVFKACRVYYTHEDYADKRRKDIDGSNYLLLKGFKPLLKLFMHAIGIRRFEKEWRNKADDLFLDKAPRGASCWMWGAERGHFLPECAGKTGWSRERTWIPRRSSMPG
jgi:hypothetical protein